MNLIKPFLAAATVASTMALAAPASAVDAPRIPIAHATAFCQPALPAFDGLVRKRPLAVQNEGSSNAFVTCSIPLDLGAATFDGVAIYFVNNNEVDTAINCTMANGGGAGSVVYIPKSTVVPPGGGNNSWTPADNGGDELVPLASFSCNLPPGTGIHMMYAAMEVDVGA